MASTYHCCCRRAVSQGRQGLFRPSHTSFGVGGGQSWESRPFEVFNIPGTRYYFECSRAAPNRGLLAHIDAAATPPRRTNTHTATQLQLLALSMNGGNNPLAHDQRPTNPPHDPPPLAPQTQGGRRPRPANQKKANQPSFRPYCVYI